MVYDRVLLVGGVGYMESGGMYAGGEVGWEEGGVEVVGWGVSDHLRSHLGQCAVTPTGFPQVIMYEHSIPPSHPISQLGFLPSRGHPAALYCPGSTMGMAVGISWRGAPDPVGHGII